MHYWRTVDDIDTTREVDEDGLAYLASYQFVPSSYFKIELDLEVFPEDFGLADDTVFSPQAYALLGSGIYGGLGIGTLISDGEYADDPFFALRVGFDLEILPSLRLDLNANYHFTDFDNIKTIDEDVDTDTITLGAMLRLVL